MMFESLSFSMFDDPKAESEGNTNNDNALSYLEWIASKGVDVDGLFFFIF